ncbi:MAG: hypothetical protein E6G40_09300 [Actinobacteria bacterium]|nr:MAG: hypothetical protein E6G40_09300 [Actinomycetota bacterium]
MVVRQNGGTGLFGTTVTGDPSSGSTLTDGSGDARFDPVYAGPNVAELDLVKLSVANARDGSNDLLFTFDVSSLDNLQHALDATGAPAVDYVARWTGPSVNDPQTGSKNPIYYASVEVQPGGLTTFFAGEAQSVDLCSVSACTPHILNYPAPPQGGTLVTGHRKLGHHPGSADQWVVRVPRSLVGNPAIGSLLESFSGFTLARNHSASVQITSAEGEAGLTPIEVDGVCCRDAKA